MDIIDAAIHEDDANMENEGQEERTKVRTRRNAKIETAKRSVPVSQDWTASP